MTDVNSVKIPGELRYTKTNEWARLEGDVATIGLSDFAQSELTDVVYVELPKVGADVSAGKPCGNVESVKAVSEIVAPVSGKVVEVNSSLADGPEAINKDPYGKGWYAKIKIANPAEFKALLDAGAYKTFLQTEGAGHH